MTDMNAPTIAGFEILKTLGQGGMATVWMARQISLDRTVAIKVLLPRFAVDDEEVTRFRSESQAAARLKHPGIVQVYDAGVTDGSYYFVMEYIAGYTVGDWVRRKGVLPERDALLVAEHVCDALAYAWEHARIIHCDIKPDNILIDDDGTVKVTDLGLARTLNAMSSYSEDDEHVLGTPSYMSPEQARGDAHLDFRSDIYSLGAMLYHLVTGKRLFGESDDDTALEMQITGTAADPMDLNADLSRPLCSLIERMLSKNPDRRGDSWQAVHADMRRVYSGLMPHHTLQAGDMSTVRRSERRSSVDTERLRRLTGASRSHSSAVWAVLWTAVAAMTVAMALQIYRKMAEHTPAARNHASRGTTAAAMPESRETSAETLYEAAQVWQRANPADPEGAIARYEKVVQAAGGTSYAHRANARIRVLQRDMRQTRKGRIEALQAKLEILKQAGDYAEAEALAAAYSGSLQEDHTFRERMMQEIRWHREARESQIRLEERTQQEQQGREIMEPILRHASHAILQGDLQQALELTQTLRARAELSRFRHSLQELEAGLEALLQLDYWILETFREQQGELIEVALNSGAVLLTVGAVQDGQLQCFEQDGDGAIQEMRITAQDLAPRERYARLTYAPSEAEAIAKGMMAYEIGAYRKASEFFRGAHFLLADLLSQAAEEKALSH